MGEGDESEVTRKKAKCACKEPRQRHPGDGRPQEVDHRKGRPGAMPSKSSKSSSEKEQVGCQIIYY